MTPLEGHSLDVLEKVLPQQGRGNFVGHEAICDRGWHEVRRSLRLSRREFEIVQRIFDDMNELAIAAELGISQHTVHTYLERLYRKTHVNSRVQLVVYVMSEHMTLCTKALDCS